MAIRFRPCFPDPHRARPGDAVDVQRGVLNFDALVLHGYNAPDHLGTVHGGGEYHDRGRVPEPTPGVSMNRTLPEAMVGGACCRTEPSPRQYQRSGRAAFAFFVLVCPDIVEVRAR